jgi:hypothetical protein
VTDYGDFRSAERRASPRLEVEAILNGVLAEGNLRLTLRDLGFGGFAVESPILFTIRSTHRFRFTTQGGLALALKAEVIYTRPIGPRDGMAHHATGFRFVVTSTEDEQAVTLLIDAAIAPLSFS